MTEAGIAAELSKRTGIPPVEAYKAVRLMFDYIALRMVTGHRVYLKGLGMFTPDGKFHPVRELSGRTVWYWKPPWPILYFFRRKERQVRETIDFNS